MRDQAITDVIGETGSASFTERRMVGRALAFWETLRGDRRFPDRSDCGAFQRIGMAENIFVIAVSDDEAEDEVIESGEAFRKALGRNPVGRKAIRVLPSATERGLSFCRVAAELQKPVADVGHFTNADGEEVMYRSILLPLSDDQRRVNYLLGAFSYRIAA